MQSLNSAAFFAFRHHTQPSGIRIFVRRIFHGLDVKLLCLVSFIFFFGLCVDQYDAKIVLKKPAELCAAVLKLTSCFYNLEYISICRLNCLFVCFLKQIFVIE